MNRSRGTGRRWNRQLPRFGYRERCIQAGAEGIVDRVEYKSRFTAHGKVISGDMGSLCGKECDARTTHHPAEKILDGAGIQRWSARIDRPSVTWWSQPVGGAALAVKGSVSGGGLKLPAIHLPDQKSGSLVFKRPSGLPNDPVFAVAISYRYLPGVMSPLTELISAAGFTILCSHVHCSQGCQRLRHEFVLQYDGTIHVPAKKEHQFELVYSLITGVATRAQLEMLGEIDVQMAPKIVRDRPPDSTTPIKTICKFDQEQLSVNSTISAKVGGFMSGSERSAEAETLVSRRDQWDVFIAHASEDKDALVRPLAEALRAAGLHVWYDEFNLTLGDSIRESIDRGLSASRYGIVVLSPQFFRKRWPRLELGALLSKHSDDGKVVLPVWHNVDEGTVQSYSPLLSGLKAVSSDLGVKELVSEVLRVTGEPGTDVFLSFSPSATEHGRLAQLVLENCNHVVTSVETSAGQRFDQAVRAVRRNSCFVGIWHPVNFGDSSVGGWMPFEYGVATSINVPSLILINEHVAKEIRTRILKDVVVQTYSDLFFKDHTLPVVKEFCARVAKARREYEQQVRSL